MSLKLKAFLADHHPLELQQAYHQNEKIKVFHDVACEMKFVSSDGWFEHESEQHQFLPIFHIRGNILELHGKFPYNVSTLTFDEDTIKRLDKDILYFLTPSELSYLIETGKYFTKHFQLPKVLTNNAYDFPVKVNLTVIQPEDESIYDSANFVLDKENLPIFYVEFVGTGVTRKQDKLLDYYGIDFDSKYEVYALTAESSGYTDPPLIQYIPEPEMEQETVAKEKESMDYLSPEEENSLIRATKAEEEKKEPSVEFANDYQFTEEDILIAAADKNIERRIEERRKDLKNQYNKSVDGKSTDQTPMDAQVTSDLTNLLMAVTGQTPTAPKSVSPTISADKTNILSSNQEIKSQKTEPESPEQMKKIQVDVHPLEKKFEKKFENEGEKPDQTDNLDSYENDVNRLSDAQGADVSDTRLQTKVDEAKAAEVAKSVAIDIQSDILKTAKENKEKTEERQISAKFQELLDKAEQNQIQHDDDISYE